MQTLNIQALARRGAEERYRELQAELAILVSDFPHLRRVSSAHHRAASADGASTLTLVRRRPKWSAEARKAVSRRMKKYWAARRKAKK
jgi:hypothetical protein